MSWNTEAVWDAFSQQLQRMIRARVSDPDDADDILQEVFMKIHLRLDTVNDESRLAPWLMQLTRNTIIDHYRRQRPVSDLPESLAAAPMPNEKEAERQLAGGLRAMIAGLPAGYREALLLSEIEGIAQTELAERLDLSYSGAKSRVQRGRRMLREALIECCHIELDRRGGVIDYVPRDQLCQECCRP